MDVKREFQDLDIQCWKYDGRLGKRRPCVCLQASSESCAALLAAVDELAAEEPPAQRSLTLKRCQRPKQRFRIRMLLLPANEHLHEMSLTVDGEAAIFEFTPIGLAVFREAVIAWRDGGEDFSVHPSATAKGSKDKASGEVWFWTLLTDP